MSGSLQAPRGTFDVLPEAAAARMRLERIAADLLGGAGYGRIETPVFEHTELFARGVGESTEIVSKEMYTFTDQGDRSLTLRPEGTAPVCRAYVEHGMHKLAQPVKLWYHGPFFRQEAPQAGRFRQFFQIGTEALGSDDPLLDAESIALLWTLLESCGAEGCRLRISSLGSTAERAAYNEDLRAYLRANEARLSSDVRERIELNPLRAFDSKHEGTQAVMAEAPRLLERISAEDRAHLDEVLALLDAAKVPYDVDDTLVRGLDYYTRTVFEFTSDRLGAQSGVGGGGRYDGLVELLGGPPTPGVGWAAGVERILAVAAANDAAYSGGGIDAFVALDEGANVPAAFLLGVELRSRGLTVLLEQAGRSMKGQLKQANRVGAAKLIVFGGSRLDGGARGAYDAAIKDMRTGEQRELEGLDEHDYVDRIAEELGK